MLRKRAVLVIYASTNDSRETHHMLRVVNHEENSSRAVGIQKAQRSCERGLSVLSYCWFCDAHSGPAAVTSFMSLRNSAKHPGLGWREKFSCSLSCLGMITDVLIRFITTSVFFINVLLIFFSSSPLYSVSS